VGLIMAKDENVTGAGKEATTVKKNGTGA
jgi:hypothetical protein